MRASALAPCLEACYKARQPAFLWGGPGIGKSDIPRQICKKLGIGLIDIRATQFDPVDLRGLPMLSGSDDFDKLMEKTRMREVTWAIPSFWPKRGNGIVFADELVSAPPSTQVVFYQITHDRRLGEYVLPDGWVVFGAGNRISDRGVAYQMPTPLANRFAHFELESDLEDWVTWAIPNDVPGEVIAFLKFRPELLYQFPDVKDKERNAFPTPRSWHKASRFLGLDLPQGVEFNLISGIVGKSAASEFGAYLKLYRHAPSIESIIANPSKAKIPEEKQIVYAVAIGLSRLMNKDNISRVLTYLNRLQPEFSVMACKAAADRDATIGTLPEFVAWGVKNAELLFQANQ